MIFDRMFHRTFLRLTVLGLVAGASLPAQANPLTDFAGQITGQALNQIETALGQSTGPQPGHSSANQATNQPGLNPASAQPRNSRPATSLMVSQAGMAALENMRVGAASLDVGLPRQDEPTPVTPVMAGLSDNQVREAIVRDHLVAYVAKGACMCPNQPDKAGQPCGRKAGYGHSNSNVAVCYTSQVDQRMVWEWRSAHPTGRS